MSELKGFAIAESPPAISVLLLTGERPTPEDRDLTRLFDFFSIPWSAVMERDEGVDESREKYAIVSSADRMAEAMQGVQNIGEDLPLLIRKASSVYLYGFQNNERSTKLLRLLTGDSQAKVRPIQTETIMKVTEDYPEMCGPMSGMRIPVTMRTPGCVCNVGPGVKAFQSLVRADEGEFFFAVTCAGVRFYLSAWSNTIDIGEHSPEYFDVSKHFCEAVPLVFYLRWAFRDTAWIRRDTNACLIVDDPPLKRRYGFLDFREALDLMDRHNFTTTIAFIPWNWQRTHPSTLSMFQSHPKRLSLVVHGCDHTAGEFAERSPELLNRKIRTSKQRMERFRQRSLVEADRVMVFPQGQFSAETGRALKLNGFIAAVNTEVAPAQRAASETTIADLWSVAIMKYGTFPIFTRRYPDHGIENFAFDALLGKPCLIAAHHDAFKDHARNLVDFVGRLNSLRWHLIWRPLGEAIRRSFTIRRVEDGTSIIQMFAGSMLLENVGAGAETTFLLKEEGDPDCVQTVFVNETPVEFNVEGRYLKIHLPTLPGETASIRVIYRDNNDMEQISDWEPTATKLKVAAKRYLSEFRDDYLSRSDFLYQGANRLKHLMK